MNEPRIATPEEAKGRLRNIAPTVDVDNDHVTLLRTVATEPERTRAAVVLALRDAATLAADAVLAEEFGPSADWSEAVGSTGYWQRALYVAGSIRRRADEIENGAGWSDRQARNRRGEDE